MHLTLQRRLARLSWLSIVLFPFPGCRALPRPLSSIVTLGDTPTARASGDAEKPASVERLTTRAEVVLPAGSVISSAGVLAGEDARHDGTALGVSPAPGAVPLVVTLKIGRAHV